MPTKRGNPARKNVKKYQKRRKRVSSYLSVVFFFFLCLNEKKKTSPISQMISRILRTLFMPLMSSSSGRLSRLLKRRAVGSGHKGVSRTDEILPSESPVYLPTEAHHSPADDWSDWTSFTLELEVHPATTGSDASSLRYCDFKHISSIFIRSQFLFISSWFDTKKKKKMIWKMIINSK